MCVCTRTHMCAQEYGCTHMWLKSGGQNGLKQKKIITSPFELAFLVSSFHSKCVMATRRCASVWFSLNNILWLAWQALGEISLYSLRPKCLHFIPLPLLLLEILCVLHTHTRILNKQELEVYADHLPSFRGKSMFLTEGCKNLCNWTTPLIHVSYASSSPSSSSSHQH